MFVTMFQRRLLMQTKDLEAIPLQQPAPYASFSLIAANLILFILMILNGAGIIDPQTNIHIQWGSNFSPLTLSGDSWRLLTNLFIHFGILHLVMNLYALWNIGIYLEHLLGKLNFVALYLCCGVTASLASLWWHVPTVNGAGASGAIFGLYGVFFALLTTRLLPDSAKQTLLNSTALFIGYNIFYGLKSDSGIDNAAHMGGLVSGMAFGYAYWLTIEKGLGFLKKWILLAIIGSTALAAFIYLQTHGIESEMRLQTLAWIQDSHFADFHPYIKKFDEVIIYDQTALAALDVNTVGEFKEGMENVAIPAWNKAENLIDEMKQMQISERAKEKVNYLSQYIKLRKKQSKLLNKYQYTDDDSLVPKLSKLKQTIEELLVKIQEP